MTFDQLTVFTILIFTLGLFIWGRWRYDLVSLGALMLVFLTGLIPPEDVFLGFGHPAVITVAAVLVLSRGLLNAGVVDIMSRYLARVGSSIILQVAALTGIVVLCSGFMNNVGALALLMPVAVWVSRQNGRSPSLLLMPLAFGSLLGGLITLIGTPPNIIISTYRTQTGAPPFGMFDFAPVGLGVALGGLLFIALVGWRLTPRRQSRNTAAELFQVDDYISEVTVPEHSPIAGQTIHHLTSGLDKGVEITVVGLIQNGKHKPLPSWYDVIQAGDILMVEANSDDLKALINAFKLELAECEGNCRARLGTDDIRLIEAIITPDSSMPGQTAISLNLRRNFGVNLLAVARQGRVLQQRLGQTRFVIGDILLLQGSQEALQQVLQELRCLPLAERNLRLDQPRQVLTSISIFVAAMLATALSLLPVQVAFVLAALIMIGMQIVPLDDIYRSIDWPIIVLLGAMFPIGQALETSGGAALIASHLLALTSQFSPALVIATILVGTMLLSNVVNNAAAAVLMAPIAIGLAQGLQISADPLLMAVAIGASCAFLTPVGHQSNALVMAPGGYRFGDYWRLGLPLSLLATGIAVFLILWIWPV